MKRKVSFIVIACILLTTCTAMASTFSDLNDDHWNWAKASIGDMSRKGVITGFPDGTFRPSEGVTKLHALIMIARLLGVNEKDNETYVELAEEAYKDVLKPFFVSNKREISYLLYKGVLRSDELTQYIAPASYNQVLKRYEAAVLLTKAMGKENDAKNKVMVVLGYQDRNDIPGYAKPYIACVKDEKVNNRSIMGGISDTEFGPMLDVNRATMAVMLYRVMTKNRGVERTTGGVITQIDKDDKEITVQSVIDVVKTYKIDDHVILRLDGRPAELEDLNGNESVKLTLKSDKLYAAEALSPEIDETVEGIVTYVSPSSSRNKRIKLQLDEEDDETIKEYKIDDDVVVVYKGRTSTFKSIDKYDYAKIEVKNGKVKKIEAEPKTKDVDGIVEEMILDTPFKIKIKEDDDTVREYEVLSDVTVRKNDRTSELRDVRVGDEVELTLRYNKVRKIDAEGVKKSLNGTIEEFVISKTPSIKIKKQGKVSSYNVMWDVEIKIDGRYTKDDRYFELYDLRLGYPVELSLDSDVVVKIEAKSMGQTKQMTGSVESYNESYRVINIVVADGVTGATSTHQIFVKDKAKIINSSTSRTIDLDDIEEGDIVTVMGTTDVGVFEASTIVVISR